MAGWKAKLRNLNRPDSEGIVAALRAAVGDALRLDQDISAFTSLRVGGASRYFAEVDTEVALAALLKALAETSTNYFVLGGGCNIIVRDGGFDGCVIKLGKSFAEVSVESSTDGKDVVRFGAGAAIGQMIRLAKMRGWAAVAPIAGTPGTIGGAIAMNAGSRKVGFCDFVDRVEGFHRGGESFSMNRPLSYGYRKGPVTGTDIVISCIASFESGDVATAEKAVDDALKYRSDTQPLDQKNCGSVFTNPEGDSAGRLIEQCGLKGVRVRGARISTLHANWIVNEGDATADDVETLIRLMRDRVREETGVNLHAEVKIYGDRPNA